MTKKNLILLVEDDSPILNVLKQHLEKENFELLVATDGEDGLRMALESHPSLILLDIIMPKSSGLSMLKKLRKDSWGKNAKIIILTNLSSLDSKKEANRYEVSDYITKTNCSLKELVKKIRKNL